MQLNQKARPVESNLTPTVLESFKLKPSATAFKILSDKLYVHKELAIVRELLANAHDAHTRAGTTNVPIKIHFPTRLEPWFEIKDFGTGLSDAGMMELYTTYFGSDKGNSNSEIGGFGLGSKSPFSYTDQFTVESRFNKHRTTYQAFINPEGFPAIMRLEQQSSIEPNGLTIHVPTSPDSIQAFHAAGQRILSLYGYPYEANIPIEAPPEAIFLIEALPNISIQVYQKSHAAPQNLAIMGIVPYNLDTEAAYRMNNTRLPDILYYNTIVITAPIGTFDIAVSRESLSMDKPTAALVRKIVGILESKMAEKALEAIATASTLQNAYIKYAGLEQTLQILGKNDPEYNNDRLLLPELPKDIDVRVIQNSRRAKINAVVRSIARTAPIENPAAGAAKEYRAFAAGDLIKRTYVNTTYQYTPLKIYRTEPNKPTQWFFNELKAQGKLPAAVVVGGELAVDSFITNTLKMKLNDVEVIPSKPKVPRIKGAPRVQTHSSAKYRVLSNKISSPCDIAEILLHIKPKNLYINPTDYDQPRLALHLEQLGLLKASSPLTFVTIPSTHSAVLTDLTNRGAKSTFDLLKAGQINYDEIAKRTVAFGTDFNSLVLGEYFPDALLHALVSVLEKENDLRLYRIAWTINRVLEYKTSMDSFLREVPDSAPGLVTEKALHKRSLAAAIEDLKLIEKALQISRKTGWVYAYKEGLTYRGHYVGTTAKDRIELLTPLLYHMRHMINELPTD